MDKLPRYDFTKGSIFTKKMYDSPQILFKSLFHLSFPWSNISLKVVKNDEMLNDEYFEKPLFITGTKEEIERTEEIIKLKSNFYCDRCGVLLNLFPWSSFLKERKCLTLCDYCYDDLEKQLGRNFWGIDINLNRISGTPWWFV